MCGRFVIFDETEDKELREIIDEINKKYEGNNTQKARMGEIFPTNIVPVITREKYGRSINLFKWGFPNFNNKGILINARSETLQEKQTFRKILFTKRCLIPASGFYEWKKCGESNLKDKYLIRTEAPMFYMAGLYNEFCDKSGVEYTAFVIITTDANDEMLAIHNRMPVILDKADGEKWLDSEAGIFMDTLVSYRGRLSLSIVADK